MSKFELAELLQQDINDLKGIFNYIQLDLTKKQTNLRLKRVVANLEIHLEELLKM